MRSEKPTKLALVRYLTPIIFRVSPAGWDSIFENEQSDKVKDIETTFNLFKYATQVTGAEWPEPHVAKSPCPTLKVVGLVTAAINAKEEVRHGEAKSM